MSNHKIGYLLKLSRHLNYSMSPKDISSWYSIVISWLSTNDLNIKNLPPLRYNHETDKTFICHEDRNKVICQEIWQIYTQHKWINPLEPLLSKMLYYKEHFMHFSKLGFIIRLKYLHTFLPNAVRVAIGQLKSIISPTWGWEWSCQCNPGKDM